MAATSPTTSVDTCAPKQSRSGGREQWVSFIVIAVRSGFVCALCGAQLRVGRGFGCGRGHSGFGSGFGAADASALKWAQANLDAPVAAASAAQVRPQRRKQAARAHIVARRAQSCVRPSLAPPLAALRAALARRVRSAAKSISERPQKISNFRSARRLKVARSGGGAAADSPPQSQVARSDHLIAAQIHWDARAAPAAAAAASATHALVALRAGSEPIALNYRHRKRVPGTRLCLERVARAALAARGNKLNACPSQPVASASARPPSPSPPPQSSLLLTRPTQLAAESVSVRRRHSDSARVATEPPPTGWKRAQMSARPPLALRMPMTAFAAHTNRK